MSYWLLAHDALAELEAASRATPSAEHLASFEARAAGSLLTVDAGVGEITVNGILTERPSLFAMLAGGNTTYRSIREAVAEAEANPAVREIVLSINSPGGSVDSLFPTLDALEAAKKPMRARVSLAASAAYAIAAVAGPIEANGLAASVGSVGVVATMHVDPDVVSVTSSNAPNKRPDVRTEAGRAVVREELDEIESLFVEYIARGRGVTPDTVRKSFGRGSVMLARKGKEMGMLDSIGTAASSPRRATAASLGPNQEAAALLEAQLGSASAAGADESSVAFAERLLSGLQPPAPPPPDPAAVVAAIVTGRRQPFELEEQEPSPDPKAQQVADLVVAAMRAEREGNL